MASLGILPAPVDPPDPVLLLVLGLTELAIAFMLVLGVFTGATAVVSAFLSLNALDPGPAATDPIVLVLTMLLVLAWKVAGWLGLDRWLLLNLGEPWRVSISRSEATPPSNRVP